MHPFTITTLPVRKLSQAVLVVYYVGDYYQYEILFWDYSIFQPQEMYESAD
ncbi:MAG TPA: hypothetical protein V6C71_05150 [Coleofasciculaceae cyanobacterium]